MHIKHNDWEKNNKRHSKNQEFCKSTIIRKKDFET